MSSVYVLQPITENCKVWVDENIDAEPWQWFGSGIAIEWRFMADVVEGLMSNGFRPGVDFEVIR